MSICSEARKICLNLKDGTVYTLYDSEANIDNSSYALGRSESAVWMFNRLVDPESVIGITVNDTALA